MLNAICTFKLVRQAVKLKNCNKVTKSLKGPQKILNTWINMPLISLVHACESHNNWAGCWYWLQERIPHVLCWFPCQWDRKIGWQREVWRDRVLSRAGLSGSSSLHTAGLTAAQYGKNLMPPGTQPIWMLRLPLSQAQVVQKNCSGLILEALLIHTAGLSAYSFLGGGTL